MILIEHFICILDCLIFLLALRRLHTSYPYETSFYLYLSICIAYGYLTFGNLWHLIALDLDTITAWQNTLPYVLVAKGSLFLGLLYIVFRTDPNSKYRVEDVPQWASHIYKDSTKQKPQV